MEKLLDEFVCTITEENGTTTLTYCHPTSLKQSGEGIPTYSHSGTCTYEKHTMKGKTKPIVQNFMVMVGCDMGDIIEYIYQKKGIKEEDFNDINMLIREHSRKKVEEIK
jgi:hypothetical protein